jgi:hypothetical protein
MAKFFRITDEPIETSARGRRELYPFSQLKEGQSFKVSIPALKADRLKLIRSLRAAVTNANKRYTQQGSRFGVEMGEKVYRVGRLK